MPITDASAALDNLNQIRVVRIVEKRKLPSGEPPEMKSVGKRRKQGWAVPTAVDSCEQLLFMLVLTAVHTRTLLRCLSLSRSWNSFIRAPGFRRIWAGQGETLLLLTGFFKCCRCWIPGSSSSVSRLKLFGRGTPYHIVASAGGLVCMERQLVYVQLMSRFPELVVGNPVTDEWVQLPLPEGGRAFGIPSFRMEVVEDGGFRVAAFGPDAETSSVTYCIYDSVSDTWSKTELFFPASDAGAKRAYFDLSRDAWVRDAVSSESIRTGLERREDEVHALPHPFLQGFCFWEHRGHRYFASPWYAPGVHREVSGFGVWRVGEATGKLELVDAVWATRFMEENLMRKLGYLHMLFTCNASGRFVCFDYKGGWKPGPPKIVYDLDTRCWSSVAFGPRGLPGIAMPTSAVLYSPSLLAPRRVRSLASLEITQSVSVQTTFYPECGSECDSECDDKCKEITNSRLGIRQRLAASHSIRNDDD